MADSNPNVLGEEDSGSGKKTADMIAFDAIKEALDDQGYTGSKSRFMVKGRDGSSKPPTVQSMINALIGFALKHKPQVGDLHGLRASEKGRGVVKAEVKAIRALSKPDKYGNTLSVADQRVALQAALDSLNGIRKGEGPKVVKGKK